MKVSDFGPNGYRLPSVEVNKTFVGNIVYPPGGRYGPRLQADIQLVLLHTGSMEVRIDGITHAVPPAPCMPTTWKEFPFQDVIATLGPALT